MFFCLFKLQQQVWYLRLQSREGAWGGMNPGPFFGNLLIHGIKLYVHKVNTEQWAFLKRQLLSTYTPENQNWTNKWRLERVSFQKMFQLFVFHVWYGSSLKLRCRRYPCVIQVWNGEFVDSELLPATVVVEETWRISINLPVLLTRFHQGH